MFFLKFKKDTNFFLKKLSYDPYDLYGLSICMNYMFFFNLKKVDFFKSMSYESVIRMVHTDC